MAVPAAAGPGDRGELRAGGAGGRRRWVGEFVVHLLHQRFDPTQRAALQHLGLLGERDLVDREVRAEFGDLGADDGAGSEDQPKGEDDCQQDRRGSGDMHPAQEGRQRCEQEAEQDRQRNRDEDVAAEVEGGNDDDADRQGE